MIKTEPVLACAVCGVQGELRLRDCFDHLTGISGTWKFYACPVCHSLWLNPCPIEADIPILYPKNYGLTRTLSPATSGFPLGFSGSAKLAILQQSYGYASLEGKADNQLGVMLGRFLGFLFRGKAGHSVQFLSYRSSGKLLDVGCGNGDFMLWMQQIGWQVEGIELDPLAAKIAIERGLRVNIAKIEEVDFPPASFDAITLSHVAEHFPNPARIFEKLAPFLKPDGVLVSVSPNPGSILRRIFGNKWYALDPPRHLFIPSARAYRRMRESVGLRARTWTSMRLFHWVFQESGNIARKRKLGTISNSIWSKFMTTFLAALFSCWPGLGEEVVCYATKR
ncbi:MAG: class I SAM-dependent methyltransferase [Verrucomicrobiota bacterium]|nr:class I SAM-dependent methyltransferase [Verrucomicrobiota bacterium]